MVEILIALFLVGVGLAALVVTFPWGLALLLVFAMWKFGVENTVDDVRLILGFILKLVGYCALAFLFLIVIMAILD